MLDEIKYGYEEHEVMFEGHKYLISTKGGSFYGYADVKDGVCTKFEMDHLIMHNSYQREGNSVWVPFNEDMFPELNETDVIEIKDKLDGLMASYLENKVLKEILEEAA